MMVFILVLLSGCKGKPQDSAPVSDTHADDTGSPLQGCAAVQNPAPLEGDLCVEQSPCRWSGDQSYGYLGWAVASGGDLDGDQVDDVILSAPDHDASGGDPAMVGRVTIIPATALQDDDNRDATLLYGESAGDGLGRAVLMAGDLDGDGLDDAVLGADGVNQGVGEALILYGSTTGWQTELLPSWSGESAQANVGTTLGAPGDVNGDGLADLLITGELKQTVDDVESYRPGRVYLLSGQRWSGARSLADASAHWDGAEAQEGAGLSLGGADMDGDGYADIAAGAPYANANAGKTYLLPGGPDPITGDLADALTLPGQTAGDLFGWKVGVADVTGDGLAEVIVSAPLVDQPWEGGGRVSIYAGSSDFFSDGPTLLGSIQSGWDDQQLGTGLAVGGDLNGDGTSDLVLGAVAAYQGLVTKGGRVLVWYGSDSAFRPDTSLDTADVVIHGAGVKDYLGGANAMGDLNADGKDDLLLGSGFVNLSSGYDVGTVYLFWGE